MARLTRTEQRAVTRQRLIHAAGRVFCRMGFEAAPIDVIAEEAGFSRGAFYSNFESKDELFVELIGHHLASEIDTLSHALNRINSAHDLAPAIERRYQVLGEDGSWCLLTTEFQLYTMRGGIKAGQFAEIYESYRQRLGSRRRLDQPTSPEHLSGDRHDSRLTPNGLIHLEKFRTRPTNRPHRAELRLSRASGSGKVDPLDRSA